MSKVTERANELYPNSKTFCGGVASIARDAYFKGCEETIENVTEWLESQDCNEYREDNRHIFIMHLRKALDLL